MNLTTSKKVNGSKIKGLLLLVLILFCLTLPLLAAPYYVYLATSILITALFAGSLNLVLGYGGLMQLHHAVFYGLGAYAAALLLTKSGLPFWGGCLLAPFVAALGALILGWFCVRLRGLYFGMLMLALGQLIWAVVYRWYDFTGGDDGIHGVPIPDWLTSVNGAYFFVFLVCGLSFLALYLIVHSPFGLILQAIRDNATRSESIGVNNKRHQLGALVISGFFAGVAGVLFVILERSVSPTILYWSKSAEIMVMCLLGGMYTFFGPLLGAVVIVLLATFFGVFTEYWLMVLGSILLAVVLFLPQGILGFLAEMWSKGRNKGGGEANASGSIHR